MAKQKVNQQQIANPFYVVTAGQATVLTTGTVVPVPTQPDANYYVSVMKINTGNTNSSFVVVDGKTTSQFTLYAVAYPGQTASTKTVDYIVARGN